MPEAAVLVVGRFRPELGAAFAERTRAHELIALPIRTRLVRAHDDLAGVVAEAVRGIARPGDVVAVSETAVAIAQNRIIAAETIRPSKLAYLLAARAGALATINQPESLQLVIDEAGAWRVLKAAILHMIGRLRGKRGVFYEILGETIAAIDGYTGTLPPFERTIVLGPDDPDGVARAIATRIRAHTCIVDANDLGIAKVLGASPGVDRAAIERALLANPHGNADEQTPIVVLAWRASGPGPLVTNGTPS